MSSGAGRGGEGRVLESRDVCSAGADTQAEMNAPSRAMKTLKVREDVEESTMRSSALVPKRKDGRATRMTPMKEPADARMS